MNRPYESTVGAPWMAPKGLDQSSPYKQLMGKRTLVRPQKLAESVVIIDGVSGSGKTLVAPLLSTMTRGELWIFDHLFEYLCVINRFKGIRRDAAKMLLDLYADIDLYNLMIGRNTNFRSSDASSASLNLLEERYQKRLSVPEGEAIVKQIQKTRPILYGMTHYTFGVSGLLYESWQERLKAVIVPVRHPMWLVEIWFRGSYHQQIKRFYGGGWHDRIGQDPREFQLCMELNGKTYPWYTAGWENEYARLNPLEKAIAVIEHFTREFEKQYRRLRPADRAKTFRVPFEKFVTAPWTDLKKITDLLGIKKTPLTGRMMRKQDLPRTLPADYFTAQRKKMDDLLEAEKVSAASRKRFEKLCVQYEEKYWDESFKF